MRRSLSLTALLPLFFIVATEVGFTATRRHRPADSDQSADVNDSADATPAPARKKSTGSGHSATPAPQHKSKASRNDSDASREDSAAADEKTPSKKRSPENSDDDRGASTSLKNKKTESPDATPAPVEKSVRKNTAGDADVLTPSRTSGSHAEKLSAAASEFPADDSQPQRRYFPAAIIPTSEIAGFENQPPQVRSLIEAALELTKRNLTYTYGSADPGNGGMDCSGTIYYLLKQQGFSDVPRDASGQYVWARKNGLFFSVLSRKAGGFEFSDLLPGDLLFWNGTYSIDRDPPVTHTMIYLGVQKHRTQQVMWGSSDGRSFDGKQRWGVSVFDFTMPKADSTSGSRAVFLGYARIPGLRDGTETHRTASRDK